jgi:hypothetical protein
MTMETSLFDATGARTDNGKPSVAMALTGAIATASAFKWDHATYATGRVGADQTLICVQI